MNELVEAYKTVDQHHLRVGRIIHEMQMIRAQEYFLYLQAKNIFYIA